MAAVPSTSGKCSNTDVYDTRTRGLVLRCRASGRHTYRLQIRRGRWLTIGAVDDFSPNEARVESRASSRRRGARQRSGRRAPAGARSRRSGRTGERVRPPGCLPTGNPPETLRRLRQAFAEFLPLSMAEITQARARKRWRDRTHGLKKRLASTVNRDLAALRASAFRPRWFGSYPCCRLIHSPGSRRRASTAGASSVTFPPSEEMRLRAALTERDTRRRLAREAANRWRRERSYDELPPGTERTQTTSRPLTLLALNTGCRRGELLALTWGGCHRDGADDSRRKREERPDQTHSDESGSARDHHGVATSFVQAQRLFDFQTEENGQRSRRSKTAWAPLLKRASIEAFRFHDLRHTFASKLVMAGVDLNTVRELLGHADLKMTLRYAHLAPEIKAAAVEKLVLS